jgi:hypothetical protein
MEVFPTIFIGNRICPIISVKIPKKIQKLHSGLASPTHRKPMNKGDLVGLQPISKGNWLGENSVNPKVWQVDFVEFRFPQRC